MDKCLLQAWKEWKSCFRTPDLFKLAIRPRENQQNAVSSEIKSPLSWW